MEVLLHRYQMLYRINKQAARITSLGLFFRFQNWGDDAVLRSYFRKRFHKEVYKGCARFNLCLGRSVT